MWYHYNDEKITYIGRWGIEPLVEGKTATATGSKITFRFQGNEALLYFNLQNNVQPYPHLWIILDEKTKVEVPLDKIIRIEAVEDGIHTLDIILKSALEIQHRWVSPLISKVTFVA